MKEEEVGETEKGNCKALVGYRERPGYLLYLPPQRQGHGGLSSELGPLNVS